MPLFCLGIGELFSPLILSGSPNTTLLAFVWWLYILETYGLGKHIVGALFIINWVGSLAYSFLMMLLFSQSHLFELKLRLSWEGLSATL